MDNAVEPSDFFLGLMKVVPGGSSVLDLYNGEYKKAVYDLGVDIILYAATEGAGEVWKLIKSGSAWTAARASAKFIEKFGAKEGESIVIRDLTANGAAQTFHSTNRLQQSHLAELADGKFVKPSNMEDGVVMRAGTPEHSKVTAIFREGNWYAYDSKTAHAYGPALKGFVSDASSPVQKEIFADGTSALVTQKALAADAYTLPRVNGFDLVSEGKVYRYDSRNPGILTDLESADHFKPLEDFEAICHAPTGLAGRVRRGANDTCFSKVIRNISSELTQELQALEHVRLFPSPPNCSGRINSSFLKGAVSRWLKVKWGHNSIRYLITNALPTRTLSPARSNRIRSSAFTVRKPMTNWRAKAGWSSSTVSARAAMTSASFEVSWLKTQSPAAPGSIW
ncbi:hypothetical protein [Pseudomonas trivialis]|uniref:hypothetical protein n=1 Tax=Pseudomonas trivialis TaxID=200450 RepID=UPI0030CCC183